MKKYYCKCGNEIDRHTFNYGNKECRSCATLSKWQRGVFDNRNDKGENNPNFKKGLPKCLDCGKQLNDYSSKRCKSCSVIFMQGGNHPNFTGGKPKCIDCGKEIWYKKQRCIDCFNKLPHIIKCNCFICKAKRGEYKGKNSPTWQNGISKLPYAFEFGVELKLKIRTRDNFACQNCSMTEEEHLIVRGKVLHAHHIDYDKLNCKEDNLITLCGSCNSKVNYNRDYWYAYFKYIIKNYIKI